MYTGTELTHPVYKNKSNDNTITMPGYLILFITSRAIIISVILTINENMSIR
jgi:hypothetical protein